MSGDSILIRKLDQLKADAINLSKSIHEERHLLKRVNAQIATINDYFDALDLHHRVGSRKPSQPILANLDAN